MGMFILPWVCLFSQRVGCPQWHPTTKYAKLLQYMFQHTAIDQGSLFVGLTPKLPVTNGQIMFPWVCLFLQRVGHPQWRPNTKYAKLLRYVFSIPPLTLGTIKILSSYESQFLTELICQTKSLNYLTLTSFLLCSASHRTGSPKTFIPVRLNFTFLVLEVSKCSAFFKKRSVFHRAHLSDQHHKLSVTD